MKNRKPVFAVTLIAAGSGDPELLSVRAAAALEKADVAVCDPEVSELLAGGDSEILDMSTAPTDAPAVAKALVEQARAGRRAVRVFSGDPVLDGRVLAEARALHRAKVPFEILPCAGDVIGVAAYAGIGLMGPKAKQMRVVDLLSGEVDAQTLADSSATLVIRNAADSAPGIAKAALAAGRTPGTGMVVVRGGTTVEQLSVVTTLGDAVADLKAAKVTGNGDVFIGDSVGSAETLGWFESRPLFGWRVLVPRTKDQAGDLSAQLRLYGAVPVEVPTISVEPPRTPQQMERAIEGIESGRYQWIAFTSVNAVRAIRERFEQRGLDARHLAGLKIAAIGESTAAALREFGVRADLLPQPEAQTSAGLLDVWPERDPEFDPIGRVFLPRADIATEKLVAGLEDRGWEVDDITAYRTVRAAPPAAEIREAIKTGGFDAVVFTSSSTVRNLVGIAGKPHATTVIAAIGPETAATAGQHGLKVAVQPTQAKLEPMVAALAEHGEQLRQAALANGERTWRPSKRRGAGRRRAAAK
ncbi:MAG TPA: uroporphyrinogen-III synthase [Actinomycetota bacterium]|nr:uroporphyrinogen-III synthase [Actinomycetota bacterium]